MKKFIMNIIIRRRREEMDKDQLHRLINLLEQFRYDYDLDSATEFVYIAYLVRKIEDVMEVGDNED